MKVRLLKKLRKKYSIYHTDEQYTIQCNLNNRVISFTSNQESVIKKRQCDLILNHVYSKRN